MKENEAGQILPRLAAFAPMPRAPLLEIVMGTSRQVQAGSRPADTADAASVGAGGWVQKLISHIKLALEVDSSATIGQHLWTVSEGALAWYGFRFTSGSLPATSGS